MQMSHMLLVQKGWRDGRAAWCVRALSSSQAPRAGCGWLQNSHPASAQKDGRNKVKSLTEEVVSFLNEVKSRHRAIYGGGLIVKRLLCAVS